MTPLMSIGQYNTKTSTFEFNGNAFCLLDINGNKVTKPLSQDEAKAIQAAVQARYERPLSDLMIKFGKTANNIPQVFTDGASFFIYD